MGCTFLVNGVIGVPCKCRYEPGEVSMATGSSGARGFVANLSTMMDNWAKKAAIDEASGIPSPSMRTLALMKANA